MEDENVRLLLRKLVTGESGQDLIEYALLVALIATVSFAALQGLGSAVAAFYKGLQEKMASL
jgi:Flp pilus assembly pilin Flp